MKTLGIVLRTGLGTATVGVLAVMVMASSGLSVSSLGAQEQDEGWWQAEELLTGAEFKEAPDGRVIALDAYGPRDRQRNRQRGRDGYRDYDDYDDYDDDDYYDDDRYDRRDDRYDDRGRYRGRNGGIVIPGGRVRIRPKVRRGYALDRYAYRPLWRHADWRVRFRNDRYDRRRPSLRDIVGNGTVRRLRRHRDRIGAHGPLRYRWVTLGHRGEVLQIRAGRTAIAEFVDFHYDGRVDVVRLARW